MKAKSGKYTSKDFAVVVGRALHRTGLAARKTARAHGTPVYIWKDGKVVAEKPQMPPANAKPRLMTWWN